LEDLITDSRIIIWVLMTNEWRERTDLNFCIFMLSRHDLSCWYFNMERDLKTIGYWNKHNAGNFIETRLKNKFRNEHGYKN